MQDVARSSQSVLFRLAFDLFDSSATRNAFFITVISREESLSCFANSTQPQTALTTSPIIASDLSALIRNTGATLRTRSSFLCLPFCTHGFFRFATRSFVWVKPASCRRLPKGSSLPISSKSFSRPKQKSTLA